MTELTKERVARIYNVPVELVDEERHTGGYLVPEYGTQNIDGPIRKIFVNMGLLKPRTKLVPFAKAIREAAEEARLRTDKNEVEKRRKA